MQIISTPIANTPHLERTLESYIEQWGASIAILLLEYPCHTFKIPTIDGIVGYLVEGDAFIVFGDPLCHPTDTSELTRAFHVYAQKEKKRILYILASQRFMHFVTIDQKCAAIEFGDEVILDPWYDPKLGSIKKTFSLGKNFAKLENMGMQAFEYTGSNLVLEEQIEAVGKAWLQSRKGIQVYLLRVKIFAQRSRKRWFYATYNGEIIGVIILQKVESRHGWIMTLSMCKPHAPQGTSDFLLLSALDILREEKCRFLSVGGVPQREIVSLTGFGAATSWLLRKVFKFVITALQLRNRQKYWKKFHPHTEPLFIVFNSARLGFTDIRAIARIFNVGISYAQK